MLRWYVGIIVRSSHWDACCLDMERDLGYFVRTMSILARFIVNQQKKAQNYRSECLRYRGVAYKK